MHLMINILLLLVFLTILILTIFVIYGDRKISVFELFIDYSQLSQSVSEPTTVAEIPEFKQFFDWHTEFCQVWDKVIDNAMKVDQTTATKNDYIATIETEQGAQVQFPRCDPILSTAPPQQIIPFIPSVPDSYESALRYMGTEISKIKQQTEAALQGQAPSIKESFFSQQPQPICSPSCIPETPEQVESRKQAIAQIQKALQLFNSSIPSLEGQLTVIQSGLNDLDSYKQRAQSGDLIKDIKIS
jgi:hypothetical protein